MEELGCPGQIWVVCAPEAFVKTLDLVLLQLYVYADTSTNACRTVSRPRRS